MRGVPTDIGTIHFVGIGGIGIRQERITRRHGVYILIRVVLI